MANTINTLEETIKILKETNTALKISKGYKEIDRPCGLCGGTGKYMESFDVSKFYED